MCSIEVLRNTLLGYGYLADFLTIRELDALWTRLDYQVQNQMITSDVRMLSKLAPLDCQLYQGLHWFKKERNNICDAHNKECGGPQYRLVKPE
jgi:hypothetical protein